MLEVFGATTLALVGGAALVGALVLVALMAPGQVGRARSAVEHSAGRTFLVGLINLIFFTLLAAFFGNAGAEILSVVIFWGLLAVATVGLAAWTVVAAGCLGVEAPAGPRDLARGGALIVVGSLAPAVGWFIIGPIILIIAVGAGILAVYQGRPYWRRAKKSAEFVDAPLEHGP